MTILIRPVIQEDAEAIIELLRPIIEAGKYTVMDRVPSVDEQLRFINEFPQCGVFHVAVCEDSHKICGLQDVQPKVVSGAIDSQRVGEISTFVDLSLRRSGFGRKLTEVTLRRARAQGFHKITAAIRADNPEAISFYISQGFRLVAADEDKVCIDGDYVGKVLAERVLS